MTRDRYIYLKLGIIIILQLIMLGLFKVYKQIFDLPIIICLSISYIIFSIGLIYNKKISFFGYLLGLFTILFYREQIEDNYTNIDYLYKWIEHLFSNKIIFINVFGNLILYMPFIHYLKLFIKNNLYCIVLVFSFILIGEYVQYLLKIGVFDLVDIVINTLGVLIYMLVYEVLIWIKKIIIFKTTI